MVTADKYATRMNSWNTDNKSFSSLWNCRRDIEEATGELYEYVELEALEADKKRRRLRVLMQ